MDINLTKHSIYTEETLLSERCEVPIECSIVVSGKISKLIKCCFHSAVTSKSDSDRMVTADGTVSVCIIYLDSDNNLCNHEHTLPFSKQLQTADDISSGRLFVEICDERLTATALGENKVTVSGAVCLDFQVKNSVEQQVICDIDCSSIEQLRSSAELTSPMGYGEKNLIAEEEISIGNGQPSVDCLIRHSATAQIDECKIIGSKVMVKGTVNIYVLYLPKNASRPQCFEESFPYSQLVEVDNINDDCKCDGKAQIVFCELKPVASPDGDIREFSVSIKLAISVKSYCDDTIPVLEDAYSTCGRYKAEGREFTFKKIKQNIKEEFIAKKNLEFTDGAIGSVLDLWCDIKSKNIRFENDLMKLSGSLIVNLLAYDVDGIPACYERPIEFEYVYKLDGAHLCPEASVNLAVIRPSYTLMGENTVSVSAEVGVDATVYDSLKKTLLCDIVETEETPKGRNGCSIVLYFAEAGERVWDIARRYNSSVAEIKELNSIGDDCLSTATKIVIPTK